MKKILILCLILTGCTDAQIASNNLSKAADQFQIERRVVFFNGITDKYLLMIQGRCSILDFGGQLEVTCKTGENTFRKHFLGLSDNVSYFSEQIGDVGVSTSQYKVIIKPKAIIPDVDLVD